MSALRRLSVCILVLTCATACAYPRHATSLAPASDSSTFDSPGDLWQLTIVGAVIPPIPRAGGGWDDNNGLPDPYVRIMRGNQKIFETVAIENSLMPVWNVTLPRNLHTPRESQLRFEVWDDDGVFDHPVGLMANDGLPATALPGADTELALDTGARLIVRVARPIAHRGVGIPMYEARDGALIALEVLEFSPAGRGGVRVGDPIIAIDGRQVSEMGTMSAGSALSLMGTRGGVLTIERDRERRRLDIDSGFVWLTM